MARAIDLPQGGQGEVLADVEVVAAKEKCPFRCYVSIHHHHRQPAGHLNREDGDAPEQRGRPNFVSSAQYFTNKKLSLID